MGILLNAGGSIVQLADSMPFRYGVYMMAGLGLGM
jgi:hypothetical protein